MRYILLACFICFAMPAVAQTSESDIIAKMEQDGYKFVERERTWLGRVVLEFSKGQQEREIVLNPANGAIIRDYIEEPHGEEDGFWGRWLSFESKNEHDDDD